MTGEVHPETPRCRARTPQRDVLWAIIRRDGPRDEFQCQLDAGHEGQHRHSYIPYPGFANEVLRW